MNVYFRDNQGKLGCYIAEEKDHEDAIISVCEELVSTGEGYKEPVLAVIEGGKQ